MKLDDLLGEYYELEQQLADPEVHANPAEARRLGKRYSQLTPIIQTYRQLKEVENDIDAARELAAEDSSFAEEADRLTVEAEQLTERLRFLLIPRDPADDKNLIMEVKAGEGGEESALFAGDLVRMYLRYAERQGWKTEVIDSTLSDLGGYKDVTIAFKNKGTPEPGSGVWPQLKFEGGVHRVQRVPVTESQGRIHTSAAGVLVVPEAEEIEIEVHEKDLRIDVYRSSGPGGQSVNTTDSAVRITHVPTGIVASCQNEKSQLQNKEQAMRILRARLYAEAQASADAEASAERKSQVRTVDRSERVRTYNFPENRISDHRVGYKAYNLDQVLDGELDGVIKALVDADTKERLEAAQSS
ncbi:MULTISPECIES: peptide chain release factor 1 [Nocardiopsis]|uniref:Peptide chain release factor 1 n=2 Tax=Nocardiopsis alba TaxID=53437 RepID=A0A7K2IVD5_9ACTN|nr:MULTISPECIES: peptide chain release factor 1 [Nocardiopsis]AFR08758.1 peptide chain release factor 1 [Nocardiopsis alba ATCC BAA-2165]MEC3894946.1 peptide chain release factor 1 [Nocardiopsis sp. LDBS1602]MYR33930.1 peptide chain release factor 1 [Nocardiopsis alba]